MRMTPTDQKNTGENLLNLTNQMGKILSALDESSLVAITDKHGVITHVNKKFCNVSGYSAEELVGKNHRILKSGFHPQEFYKDLWVTISGGHTWHGEIKNVSKHGQYFWVDTTIVPFLDSGSLSEQYVSISTELTDQKNTEENLLNANMQLRNAAKIQKENMELHMEFEKSKEKDTLKEEFSAMITHELKTPLVPIIGYCKMLKNKMLGELNGEQLESIDTIEKNAKRLESLISDIMDVRKLDLNKMKFTLEDLAIDNFFASLDSSYRQVLIEQGKEFITDAQIPSVVIHTDKIRLRQVFDNLISNAIKFIPDKNGKITVGCKNEGNKVVFYVADNGIGIPLESQQNLFQKFYQVDTSERRKTGGTGLGLAISKGIIEKLGGRIWVESDGKTGTIFYIEFDT
ncbi:MAG: PAS domain-containing sensor histidine kinase [Candidatus Nitrosotenuis sp.]|nr:MAG: PAS domain-containing sensor histidine kinase [Candidatus Nitrosotenuis sp.]